MVGPKYNCDSNVENIESGSLIIKALLLRPALSCLHLLSKMDTSIAQDPLAKLDIAKQKKEAGDQAFKVGEIRDG